MEASVVSTMASYLQNNITSVSECMLSSSFKYPHRSAHVSLYQIVKQAFCLRGVKLGGRTSDQDWAEMPEINLILAVEYRYRKCIIIN